MTIVDPIAGAAIPPYVPPYAPYTNITPFTYRDGVTYLEKLESFQAYVNNYLVPFINTNFLELGQEFTDEVNKMITTVNDALTLQDTEVDQKITDLTKYVDDTMAAVVADGIQLQDPVMAGIVNNATSQTRVALNGLYGRKFQTNAADFATLQAAIDGTATGGSLFVPNDRTWTITATLNVARAMRIYGDGATIQQNTANLAGFNVTASKVKIQNLVIRGYQSAIVNTSVENGITLAGADTNNRLNSIVISGCIISHFGYAGISSLFVSRFEFSNNEIFDIGYGGIMTSSCNKGKIKDNAVHDIIQGSGAVNSYGIALSHLGSTPITVNPPTDTVVVYGNLIENVPNWEGIDTHGGTNLTIQNNIVNNCKFAIACVPGKDAGVQNLAPKNIVIVGNTCDSGRSDGVVTVGIELVGTSTGVGVTTSFASGVIIGNVLSHFGTDTTAGACIDVQDTSGVAIQNNVIIEAAGAAIKLDYNNYAMSILGNTIIDVWANAAAACYAINMSSQYNYATIGGNTVVARSKSATLINNRGLSIGSVSNTGVQLFPNDFTSCTFPIIDTGNVSQFLSNAKKFGTYGVPPVVRPGPAPANATDLPTAIALVNNLKASLIALGLTS